METVPSEVLVKILSDVDVQTIRELSYANKDLHDKVKKNLKRLPKVQLQELHFTKNENSDLEIEVYRKSILAYDEGDETPLTRIMSFVIRMPEVRDEEGMMKSFFISKDSPFEELSFEQENQDDAFQQCLAAIFDRIQFKKIKATELPAAWLEGLIEIMKKHKTGSQDLYIASIEEMSDEKAEPYLKQAVSLVKATGCKDFEVQVHSYMKQDAFSDHFLTAIADQKFDRLRFHAYPKYFLYKEYVKCLIPTLRPLPKFCCLTARVSIHEYRKCVVEALTRWTQCDEPEPFCCHFSGSCETQYFIEYFWMLLETLKETDLPIKIDKKGGTSYSGLCIVKDSDPTQKVFLTLNTYYAVDDGFICHLKYHDGEHFCQYQSNQ